MKNRNVVEIYDFTFGTAILFNILANTVLQRTHIFFLFFFCTLHSTLLLYTLGFICGIRIFSKEFVIVALWFCEMKVQKFQVVIEIETHEAEPHS